MNNFCASYEKNKNLWILIFFVLYLYEFKFWGMTRRIILVTGGQRSGKSGYAQRLALELSDCPVYMATSRVWDEEYRKRNGINVTGDLNGQISRKKKPWVNITCKDG